LVFIAGLIVGLQSFCKPLIDYEVEKAFTGARKTLQFLAMQSPQARQYSEILALLSIAVTGHREMYSSSGQSRYVSRLFSLGESRADLELRQASEPRLNPNSEFGIYNPIENTINKDNGLLALNSSSADSNGETQYNWDDLDISQWDNFLQL
jgi:hypothetical protein